VLLCDGLCWGVVVNNGDVDTLDDNVGASVLVGDDSAVVDGV